MDVREERVAMGRSVATGHHQSTESEEMTKYLVEYQKSKEVEAADRGEAIARVRDDESPATVTITRVTTEMPGQYL